MHKDQHGKGLILIAVVGVALTAVMVFALVVAGSSVKPEDTPSGLTTNSATDKTDKPSVGVAFSPRPSAAENIPDFYTQAQRRGYTVSWHGDWAELAVSNGAPHQIVAAAQRYGLTPIILVGTHSERQGTVQAIRPLTAETQANYEQWAVDFAKRYQPDYFGMGNEVNSINASSASDFDQFVALFNRTAAKIKAASPGTQVFVSFQLERLKGMNGGLFGGLNEPEKSKWSLLQRFNADIIAFTTYPGLIYHSPEAIPSDYYDEILARTDKPVAFSEVGWAADDMAAGWESSPATQQRFAARFLADINNLSSEFTVWLMLHDQPGTGIFQSMGLIDASGTPRPALDTWTAPPVTD